MSLITYNSDIVVLPFSEAKDLTFHLWHFSKIFPTFLLKINGIPTFDLLSEIDCEKVLKESEQNEFSVLISDHNENYILKMLEIFEFSLLNFPFQFSFYQD